MNEENVKFILLRHGQTVSNREGRFQGWFDSELDENGIAQANCAAEYLKKMSFDAVYSSDLKRAMKTVELALKYHPEMKIEPVQALREWHLGHFEGMLHSEILVQCPEILRYFTDESIALDLPDIETREEFQKRVQDFFETTARSCPGKTILVCTHGGVFQRIFRMVSGSIAANNRLPLPSNASISSIEYFADRHGWQLTSWNINHYLENLKLVRTLAI